MTLKFKIVVLRFPSAEMLVCHCNVVCDSEIRTAVRRGAASRGAVARACGAGTDCGGCRATVDQIIAEVHSVESVMSMTDSLVLAMVEETERSLVFPSPRI